MRVRTKRWVATSAILLAVLATAPAAGAATVVTPGTPPGQPPGVAEVCDGVPPAVFDDVAVGVTHAASIDCIFAYGFTHGTATGGYRPGGSVTRGAMASYLRRYLEVATGEAVEVPDATAFTDLADLADDTHVDAIKALESLGVARGTSTSTFAPGRPVTRAQMAGFVARTQRLTGALPASTDALFDDLDGIVHRADIEALAAAGIVRGTAPSTFTPSRSVTRAQMASFLARAAGHLHDQDRFAPTAETEAPTPVDPTPVDPTPVDPTPVEPTPVAPALAVTAGPDDGDIVDDPAVTYAGTAAADAPGTVTAVERSVDGGAWEDTGVTMVADGATVDWTWTDMLAPGTHTVAFRARSDTDGISTETSRTVTVHAWTDIAAGIFHTCAIDADGAAWCWGPNHRGQLGNGTTTASSVPVEVASHDMGAVTAVVVGTSHACAIATDATVWCWGSNDAGELGAGDHTDRSLPVRVAGLAEVRDLTTTTRHTCAVDGEGHAWCWGWNLTGQVGDGGSGADATRPTPVRIADLDEVVQITAGAGHTCARDVDGAVWCWGLGEDGQLGDGHYLRRTTPVPIHAADLGTVTAVAAGGFHTCALGTGGVWCWGQGSQGQLGNGGTDGGPLPVRAAGDLDGLAVIDAAVSHACAIDANGAAWCWGSGGSGQLGDGSADDRSSPVRVAGDDLGRVRAISGGSSSTCAIDTAGAAWCWGSGSQGKLGNGSVAEQRLPVRVTTPVR